MKDFLCSDCAAHFDLFLGLVQKETSRVEINPRLVRGLDYYTRTVFEFVSPLLGAQSALAAGGRYDDLVGMLGGPSVPAVGFALGADRVVEAHLKWRGEADKAVSNQTMAVVVAMTEESVPAAFGLAQKLRLAGFSVPPLLPAKKKLKNQLSAAVDAGAKWVILIGEDELKTGELSVKDLSTRTQTKVPQQKIISYLTGTP